DVPVTGVDATDFAINHQGTANATITGVTATSSTVYRLEFDYTGSNGSLQGAIKTSGTGITDGTNAFVGAGITASDPVTVNNTPPADEANPTVASFTAGAATSSSVPFTLTFNEPVTGVSASSFVLGKTTTTASIGTITGSGTTYTIPVNFTGSGQVG